MNRRDKFKVFFFENQSYNIKLNLSYVYSADFIKPNYKINIGIYYLLFVTTNAHIFIHIYIKILNYITSTPTCFNASTPSSGSFDIAFATFIKH